MDTLADKKILITGPAGQIAFPLTEELCRDNEVWGIARFGDPSTRERCEAVGCKTRVCDLADPDFSDLPDEFDYVLHLAIFQTGGLDYDHALRVNAEGTGLLMSRFANARAVLVSSTSAVYDLRDDPKQAFLESDPVGDSKQPYSPTYAISKIAQEATARWAAREFDLPTVIARMNVSYSGNGGLPAYNLDAIMNDQPIQVPDPIPWYHPIHQRDINDQIPRLLGIASNPATIVNWAGDEMVSMVEWCEYLGTLAGKKVTFERDATAICSRPVDPALRQKLIGECRVHWREGMKQMAYERYPDLANGSGVSASRAHPRPTPRGPFP
jgi:nucleoside-diphosphate-sugar epimerase